MVILQSNADELEGTAEDNMNVESDAIVDEDEEDVNDDDEEDEEGDMSPVEIDDLEAPSDAEESEEEEKPRENQGTTLFVRNIQFEATEDELYAL